MYLSESLHQALCYYKEALLLNLKMIEVQGQMISKVSAKQTRDNLRDNSRAHFETAFMFVIIHLGSLIE